MKLRTLFAVVLIGPVRPASAADPVDYLGEVRPILSARCYSCHGAIRKKAGLRLDTAEFIRRGGDSGPCVEPGEADASLLIDRVTSADIAERMPPEHEGVPLGEGEVDVLRRWIDQGASAPLEAVPADPRTHWAYRAPERPAVPEARNPAWARNPIDAFLSAGHREGGLVPNPPVSDDLWLRRVTLDLIGLPPTRAEIAALRADSSPDAREKVADRLLASPQHGERWGRHWMDVWRYSDWYGLGAEIRFSHPHIWRWRDWIVESLNADKGYDRMVVEMLAGDEVAPEDPATLRATGFLVRNWDIFSRDKWLSATVEHTARAFLGVTIQCARCHDHKFDPVSQVEYYRLRAFFEPSHVRIDRVPGQPDRAKAGLSRSFDDFHDAPTYLFIRGDEGHPDKGRPLTPGTPAVLGGEAPITPVPLPRSAWCPDKRDFVVRETREAAEKEVVDARSALDAATKGLAETSRGLADALESDRQAQDRVQASASKPAEEQAKAKEAAVQAVGRLANARREAAEAAEALRRAESALPLAEARRASLAAVLRVDEIDDREGGDKGSAERAEAAVQASAAQKRLAVLEAGHARLIAREGLERAQRALDRLAASPSDPKDKPAQEAAARASAEVVEARGRLASAEAQLAKAEAGAKELPTTAFAPRPLSYTRAKTTYRGEVSNAPYARVSTGRRLALARWIADRRNPLAARVAVNHIWARHFGEPLVASMFDFGLRTPRPEHHALLDWLAVELMESGWSMKRLHRLIVTSEAYRMQSTDAPPGSPNATDPDNRHLWKMNVRRMEAEVVRDSLLHLAGKLDPTMGGEDLPVASAKEGTRRTIYYRYTRDEAIPFLATFDAASVEECYRRPETIVPQQALALTNSGLALATAADIAAEIGEEVGEADSPEARSAFVASAFERILGRGPSEAERAECVDALDRLKALCASGEAGAKAPHLRARAELVHVLLNHNDFISIR